MSDYVGDNRWIPTEQDNASGKKLVWSTKSINDLLVALDKGYRPQVSMPFYEGKQNLRKGNIVFEYPDEEVAELARCANDIVYFAEKYAVVMTDEDIQRVKMRDYQKDLLHNFQKRKFGLKKEMLSFRDPPLVVGIVVFLGNQPFCAYTLATETPSLPIL